MFTRRPQFIALAACLLAGATGLAGAALPLLQPAPQSPSLGVLLPPFGADRAMSLVTRAALPVVDIRLGGRLVVVMAAADGPDAALLRAAGLILVAAAPPPSCLGEPDLS